MLTRWATQSNLMQLTTQTLTDWTADTLGFLTESGFRYFRSYTHFRRKDPHGFSYITVNATTHNRASYNLAFYFGTRIEALEHRIRQILGGDSKLDHWCRSITNYTVNIGPSSPHWSYPVRGKWSYGAYADLESSKLRSLPSCAISHSRLLMQTFPQRMFERPCWNRNRKHRT